MTEIVLPDNKSDLNKKRQIENMFDGIAHRYDLLNNLLSFNIDKCWRKKVINILMPFQPKIILDVATGTGDLAIALTKLNPVSITAIDISNGMLQIAQKKIKNKNIANVIEFKKADSEDLPFENDFFDAVTVGFGIRNFENLNKGLSEIYSVLKPNGHFVILEFSKVKIFPLKQFYQFYSRCIIPLVGKLISKNSFAYQYLPNSVQVFPEGEEMCVILQHIGYKNVKCKRLSFGIVSIYHCQK